MSNVVKLPTSLPPPGIKLELARLELAGILKELSVDLMNAQLDMMKVESAPEVAAIVRRTFHKLTEARASWLEMSRTIRDSWGI